MKEGWEYKTLGELALSMADGPFGSNLKKEHYTNRKEVRIIQLSNIGEDGWREDNTKYTSFEHLETIKRSEVEPGDIVIAKMMPAGRAIICPNNESKYVLSSDAVRVTLKEDLNNRFILFSINSPYFRKQVYENVSGSGRVRTSLTKLRDCKIGLPPLSEQQSIVDYLDSAFAKIDAMKANAEKRLNEAQALFQASLKKMLEPKEGWEEKSMKEIVHPDCSLSYGIVQPGEHIDDGVPVVRPVDFNNKVIVRVEGLKRTKKEISDAYKRTILKGGEILLCVRGTTGTMGLASDELQGCNVTRGIVPIFFDEHANKMFVYYQLLSPKLQTEIQKKTTGAALKQINIKDLRALHLFFPSLSEQQAIVDTLNSLKSKVDKLQENYEKISQECDALKQAILRQVFE